MPCSLNSDPLLPWCPGYVTPANVLLCPAAGEGYPPQRPVSEAAAAAAGHSAGAVEPGLSATDGLWLLDMLSGKPSLLLTLAQLWDAVTRGPLSGRTDPLTGLQYHHAEAPPSEAAVQCMHWVSRPQVHTAPQSLNMQLRVHPRKRLVLVLLTCRVGHLNSSSIRSGDLHVDCTAARDILHLPAVLPFQASQGLSSVQFSRDGDNLAFLYNVGRCQKLDEQRWTYVFTASVDGSGLWRVPVVAGARHSSGSGGRLLVCDGTGYYEVLDRREVHRLELPNSGEWPHARPERLTRSCTPHPLICHAAASRCRAQ